MQVTKKELKKLFKLTIEEKGMVWAKLNAYKTPKPFKYLKPLLSKHTDTYNSKNIRSLLMAEIERQIGKKATSLAWWKYQKLDITKHCEWWEVTFNGN